jgi:hypothetical protein
MISLLVILGFIHTDTHRVNAKVKGVESGFTYGEVVRKSAPKLEIEKLRSVGYQKLKVLKG